jgi:hypothetical protein
MKTVYLLLAAVMSIALCLADALAQAAASAPAGTASAATAAKPPPRLLTPAQARDSATAPGELRPERQVTPQLTIPLSRKPVPPPSSNEGQRGQAATAGGINDAVARCEAQSDAQARARCRPQPAAQPPSKL